jgi:hypothetical protein
MCVCVMYFVHAYYIYIYVMYFVRMQVRDFLEIMAEAAMLLAVEEAVIVLLCLTEHGFIESSLLALLKVLYAYQC